MVTFALLAALLGLGLTLAVRRGWLAAPDGLPRGSSRREWAAAVVVAVLASSPLLLALPALLRRPVLDGDARTHMLIAAAIAKGGLLRAWVDVYQGGFPIGPHYPSVGWLLDAALIRVGIPAPLATHVLGLGALLAVPAVAFGCARGVGASAPASAAVAVFLAWVAPESGFVGGAESYLRLGLLSQVCAMPLAVALAGAVLADRRRLSPWLGAAAMAAHPQVAVATVVLLSIACVAIGRRAPWATFVRAALSAVVVGAAIFGPGIASLGVPFAWPPIRQWQIVGFGPERLAWWLADGDLLDKGRAPVLTAAWIFSAIYLAFRSRRPAARAAAIVSVAALVLAASGPSLERLGSLGALLLSFVQPLRVVATLPTVAAACVAVAVDDALAWAPSFPGLGEQRARAVVAASLVTLFVLLGVVVVPAAASKLALRARDPGAACGPDTPDGFDAAEVRGWLAALEHGRLLYDGGGPIGECANRHALDLASAVPLASTPAAGAHVGVHWTAFVSTHPEAPGAWERFEALGIRYLLHTPIDRPVDPRFRLLHHHGDLGLSVREGGTEQVGVGCVTEEWAGDERSLVATAISELRATPSLLDRPFDLVSLVKGPVGLARRPVPSDGCRADEARVIERPSEVGVVVADVTSPSAVDVVLRVASYPSWSVSVDGAETSWRRVLPGFVTVRIPAGTHRVEARTRPSWAYLAGIALALLVVAAASHPFRREAPIDAASRRADSA
jgi:hypothetical protein